MSSDFRAKPHDQLVAKREALAGEREALRSEIERLDAAVERSERLSKRIRRIDEQIRLSAARPSGGQGQAGNGTPDERRVG